MAEQRYPGPVSVYYCSKTNSTLFTTCCHVAICDVEDRCPHCKREIDMSPQQRHDTALRVMYGDAGVRRMREEAQRLRAKDSKISKRRATDG